MTEILRLENIIKAFGGGQHGSQQVLSGVTLSMNAGALTGLIGESGGGKTVLCRIVVGLEEADSGSVLFKGRKIKSLKRRSFDDCAAIQYIFQDPYASLAEELTVEDTLRETVKLCRRHGRSVMDCSEALRLAGLDCRTYGKRNIRTLSGGQRQRVGIARALVPRPDLLIADECTSMLDDDAAYDICDIFRHLKHHLGISVLLVTHDVRGMFSLCDQIAVLHEGVIIEQDVTERIMNEPSSDYTREYVARIRQIEGIQGAALFNGRDENK